MDLDETSCDGQSWGQSASPDLLRSRSNTQFVKSSGATYIYET